MIFWITLTPHSGGKWALQTFSLPWKMSACGMQRRMEMIQATPIITLDRFGVHVQLDKGWQMAWGKKGKARQVNTKICNSHLP